MKLARILALVLAGLSVFALAACGKQEVPEKEQLVVGTSTDYPPFEFHVTIGGKDTIVGADIDLAKKIADDMGKELVVKDIAFEHLLEELNMGNVDLVISDMVATDDRLAEADASDPYYSEDFQRVLFLKEDADKYTTFASLEGAKLAVQTGSLQAMIAAEYLPGCDVVLYTGVTDMLNALSGGKVDAVLLAGNTAESYVETNKNLALLDEDFPKTDGSCVWIAKGDPKGLMESVNQTISYVKINNLMATWLTAAAELTH